MTINPNINRYRDLMALLPDGAFYDRDGTVIPYSDKPYTFSVTTDAPSTLFGIFLSGTFQGVVTSDALGNVEVSVLLHLGENVLEVVQNGTQETTKSYLTTRNYAVWQAAYAEEIERIDDYIDEVRYASGIGNAFSLDLEDAWGKRVGQSNVVAYDAGVYRNLVQELHQAYRLFGAKVKGHETALAAFCQVPPLDWFRLNTGKRWVLSLNFLDNGCFDTQSHSVSPVPSIPGLSLSWLGPMASSGAASLTWDPAVSLVSYTDPTGTYVVQVDPVIDGEYTLSGALYPATKQSVAELFDFSSGNHLRLSVDGLGYSDIYLSTIGLITAADVAATINAYLLWDFRYGAAYAACAADVGGYVRITSVQVGTLGSIEFEPASASYIFNVTAYDKTLGYQDQTPSLPAALAGPAGPFDIFLGLSDGLELDIDGKGLLSVTLTAGFGRNATDIASDITGALVADPRYGIAYAFAASAGGAAVTLRSLLTGTSGSITCYSSGAMLSVFGLSGADLPKQVRGYFAPVGKVRVTHASLPNFVTTQLFTVYQSPRPNGWYIDASASGLTYQVPRQNQLAYTSLYLTSVGADVMAWRSVRKEADAYKGFEFITSAWIRTTAAGCTAYIGRSFDDGVTWVESAGIAITPIEHLYQTGFFASDTYIYDPDATSFLVRIRISGAGAFDAYLDMVGVAQPEVTGAYLRRGTILRNRHRSFFSHLVLGWSPEILTADEVASMGLGTPPAYIVGQIDRLSGAHTQVDRFNVTEYDLATGAPYNVKGCALEASWVTALSINMGIVGGVPDRFSHLEPTVAGTISEAITPVGTVPHLASVVVASDLNDSTTVVLRDGTPIPRTTGWSWVTNYSIQIEPAYYSSSSAYEVQYRALYQATSAPIDLGDTYTNYVWLADYHAFCRYDATRTTMETTIQLVIDYGSFRATLAYRAEPDVTVSKLVRDDGVETYEIPRDSWAFVDDFTVSIDGSFIKTGALYTLTYQQIGMTNTSAVAFTFEVRSATTMMGLGAATYKQISRNQAVKTHDGYRYHQLRLTLTGAEDTRDFRLTSMVLKGLNLFGPGGIIPGLRP